MEKPFHVPPIPHLSKKMAKRVADQQLTKDGTTSDEDVFSVGSQIGGPQRATAAQMAQRRYVENLKFRVFMSDGRLQICLSNHNIVTPRQQHYPLPTNLSFTSVFQNTHKQTHPQHFTLSQHSQTLLHFTLLSWATADSLGLLYLTPGGLGLRNLEVAVGLELCVHPPHRRRACPSSSNQTPSVKVTESI